MFKNDSKDRRYKEDEENYGYAMDLIGQASDVAQISFGNCGDGRTGVFSIDQMMPDEEPSDDHGIIQSTKNENRHYADDSAPRDNKHAQPEGFATISDLDLVPQLNEDNNAMVLTINGTTDVFPNQDLSDSGYDSSTVVSPYSPAGNGKEALHVPVKLVNLDSSSTKKSKNAEYQATFRKKQKKNDDMEEEGIKVYSDTLPIFMDINKILLSLTNTSTTNDDHVGFNKFLESIASLRRLYDREKPINRKGEILTTGKSHNEASKRNRHKEGNKRKIRRKLLTELQLEVPRLWKRNDYLLALSANIN